MDNQAEQECRLFARYLVNREPSEEISSRYLDAQNVLIPNELSPRDQAIISYILRHPGSLPHLDAYTRVFSVDSVLQHKLLIMTAILETTTDCVDLFRPIPFTRLAFCYTVVRVGITSMVKCVLGMCLFNLVRFSNDV